MIGLYYSQSVRCVHRWCCAMCVCGMPYIVYVIITETFTVAVNVLHNVYIIDSLFYMLPLLIIMFIDVVKKKSNLRYDYSRSIRYRFYAWISKWFPLFLSLTLLASYLICLIDAFVFPFNKAPILFQYLCVQKAAHMTGFLTKYLIVGNKWDVSTIVKSDDGDNGFDYNDRDS